MSTRTMVYADTYGNDQARASRCLLLLQACVKTNDMLSNGPQTSGRSLKGALKDQGFPHTVGRSAIPQIRDSPTTLLQTFPLPWDFLDSAHVTYCFAGDDDDDDDDDDDYADDADDADDTDDADDADDVVMDDGGADILSSWCEMERTTQHNKCRDRIQEVTAV
ncbi:hypothetical protein M501DRAFT_1059932 [Patellaria atrata CBS 101060]|uniref:Uncharacterized protein n=1 Tax=Patellaria atrata CBS 101060 TaxID=1346257 RepID=A0A9P4VP99_9PEZI|nr:hypothetical protein M501DRAFT_1059932 [Patellaria atrata CBS 101060]